MSTYLPARDEILALPDFTPEEPMRILVSGCLAGNPCGYDGTPCGTHDYIDRILARPNVRPIPFCPEDSIYGTPRPLSNIDRGNGFDVLDGNARVLTEEGEDWTEGMLEGAARMLAAAERHKVHLAILMDISAACGSQVIYNGPRSEKNYVKGPGLCAAILIRNGFRVVSQRDYRTLELLLHRLDPTHIPHPDAYDHHESEWYREYFEGSV